MSVQILRKSDTETGFNVRRLLWKTPMRENGQEVGKTQREPSDGDAALILSEGERKVRSSRRKYLKLSCSSRESVAKPLRSPWTKVIHQKSITYPRKKPVIKPLLCSVIGQEKPVESEAWEWRVNLAARLLVNYTSPSKTHEKRFSWPHTFLAQHYIQMKKDDSTI